MTESHDDEIKIRFVDGKMVIDKDTYLLFESGIYECVDLSDYGIGILKASDFLERLGEFERMTPKDAMNELYRRETIKCDFKNKKLLGEENGISKWGYDVFHKNGRFLTQMTREEIKAPEEDPKPVFETTKDKIRNVLNLKKSARQKK